MEPPRAHRTGVAQTPPRFKWKTIIALILLIIAIVFNWGWAFGILFIAWAVYDIMAGRIYFVEEELSFTQRVSNQDFWMCDHRFYFRKT